MTEPLSICVVGAGVIGLHVAVRLQKDFPAARITIVAAGQGAQTTSIGAAGIFRPGVLNAATPGLTRWVTHDYSADTSGDIWLHRDLYGG